ncbi:unnamed protein product [Lasius platythorax]|uniref:Uncharacterized protein n=1 Tax=Lasius platythorax TaxID=488582 RepID=A0AAV2NUU1_9HYME
MHSSSICQTLAFGMWRSTRTTLFWTTLDYKRGAFIGFIIASFFLPMLMGYSKVNLEMMATAGFLEAAKEFE